MGRRDANSETRERRPIGSRSVVPSVIYGGFLSRDELTFPLAPVTTTGYHGARLGSGMPVGLFQHRGVGVHKSRQEASGMLNGHHEEALQLQHASISTKSSGTRRSRGLGIEASSWPVS